MFLFSRRTFASKLQRWSRAQMFAEYKKFFITLIQGLLRYQCEIKTTRI